MKNSHHTFRDALEIEPLELRQMLAADMYEPGIDPVIGSVVTAFIRDDPQDSDDSWDIETNWKAAATELSSLGATEITFAVYRVVDSEGGLSGGPSFDVVSAAVKHASNLGLSVTILPVFESDHFGWRGEYNPSGVERANFQSHYANWIAGLAGIPNVSRLNIGSELNAMVSDSENHLFFASLTELARQSGYEGRLGYTANFDIFMEKNHQTLWAHQDISFAGISAYFSLIDEQDSALVATTEQVTESVLNLLVENWTEKLNELNQFSETQQIPVILQEFGATQRNYSSIYPWAVEPGSLVENAIDPHDADAAEQEATYESLIIALDGRGDEFESVHFWSWEHGSDRGRRTYENIDPTEPRYINSFAIWPTDGGAGEYLSTFLATGLMQQLGDVELKSISSETSQSIEFQTYRSGLLTVVADQYAAGTELPEFALYDAAGQLLAGSNAGSQRIDVAASAGETFRLHIDGGFKVTIANLLSFNPDGSVWIYGSELPEQFQFSPAKNWTQDAHGLTILADESLPIAYSFLPSSQASFTFIGSSSDHITFYDSNADDTFQSSPLSAVQFDAHERYRVAAYGFENVLAVANGNGSDRAILFDSSGADHFYVDERSAILNALDGSSTVSLVDFEQAEGFSSGSPFDVAILHDGVGDDLLSVDATQAELVLASGSSRTARSFATIHAYSHSGGQDLARFWDSPGDDTFYADPDKALLQAGGRVNYAEQFEHIVAYANNGGNDLAILQGGSNQEVFEADDRMASMTDGVDLNEVHLFDSIFAYANGDNDVAILRDSVENDTFAVTPEFSSLTGPNASFSNYATGFHEVVAIAENGGYDLALFYDSLGVGPGECEWKHSGHDL